MEGQQGKLHSFLLLHSTLIFDITHKDCWLILSLCSPFFSFKSGIACGARCFLGGTCAWRSCHPLGMLCPVQEQKKCEEMWSGITLLSALSLSFVFLFTLFWWCRQPASWTLQESTFWSIMQSYYKNTGVPIPTHSSFFLPDLSSSLLNALAAMPLPQPVKGTPSVVYLLKAPSCCLQTQTWKG